MTPGTTIYEIPLSPEPQTFGITLVGIQYTVTVVWSWISAAWLFSLGDASNNPLISSIPLVTGADLFEGFEYLGIGGQLIVQTDFDPDAVPTIDNLGTNGHVYFVPYAAAA